MINKLHDYIQNPDNTDVNFDLGFVYENQGQTAAAVSYYLRTAEKSNDPIEQYESLLRCVLCFEKQGDRNATVKSMLQRAISLIPDRPEGYFLLSRSHERVREWQEAYMIACVALSVCDFSIKPLKTDVEYPGKYALIFQKGISSWWVGLCEESRIILGDLKYNHTLNPMFTEAVERNLLSIGYPNSNLVYNKDIANNIRFKFKNINIIEKNYSQCYQDLFVLSALDGKKNGLYLEIGSAEPFKNNNTALLEEKFGWKGISIDYDKKFVKQFFKERQNPVFCFDATQVNYTDLLGSMLFEQDIDYLQLDCDPPSVTFDILKKIPFDTYRFATITYEHDYYKDPSFRELSRDYLKSKGYQLIAGDIAYNDTNNFEDWWVHPNLIEPEIKQKMIDASNKIKFAKDYMFPK